MLRKKRDISSLDSVKWVFLPVLIFISFIIFLPQSFSLATFPSQTEINDFSKSQTFIMTVLNDGPKTEEITVTVDPYSFYLSNYVKITPKSFKLAPNSRKNIELDMQFPSSLSPEKHTLAIVPMTKDSVGEKSDYFFTVPGIARHDLRLIDVSANNISVDESLFLDIVLNNRGNVIARATPRIEIYNDSGLVDELEYQSKIMVMPQSKYNISLRHEFFEPIAGKYRAKAHFEYTDNSIDTNTVEAVFYILEEKEQEYKTSFNYHLLSIAGIILIFIIIIIKTRFFPKLIEKIYYKRIKKYEKQNPVPKALSSRDYSERIEILKKKLTTMERNVFDLVQDSDSFISSSNKWFNSKFGDESYEFR